MTTLEILRQARATIANPRHQFYFGDWTACACGHIYKAAVGHKARSQTAVHTNARVRAAFEEIARVLNLPEPDGNHHPAYYGWALVVSNATYERMSEESDDVTREHALSLIDDAITALEAEQERNRLDVLAQARNIIDNAPVLVA